MGGWIGQEFWNPIFPQKNSMSECASKQAHVHVSGSVDGHVYICMFTRTFQSSYQNYESNICLHSPLSLTLQQEQYLEQMLGCSVDNDKFCDACQEYTQPQ